MNKVLFLYFYSISSFAGPLDGFLDFITGGSSKNPECESCISLHDSDKAGCPEHFIKQVLVSSAKGALTAESPDELCLKTIVATSSMFNTVNDLELYIRTHPKFTAVSQQAPVLSACLSEHEENRRSIITAEYYSSLQRLHDGLDSNLKNIASIDQLLEDNLMSDISCGDLDELSESCENYKKCSNEPKQKLGYAAAGTLAALKTMEAVDREIKALKGPRSRTVKANKEKIQALKQRKKDIENMYPWIAGSKFQSLYDPKDFSFKPGNESLEVEQTASQLKQMAGLIKIQLAHTRKSLKSRQVEFKKARNCLMYNLSCGDLNMVKVLSQTPKLNNAEIFNRQAVREQIKKSKKKTRQTNNLFKAQEASALFSSVDCLQEQRSAVKDIKKDLALGALDTALVLGTVGLGSAAALNRMVLTMSRGLSRGQKISRAKKMQSLGIAGVDIGASAPYMKEAFSQCEGLMNQLEDTAKADQQAGGFCNNLSVQSKLTSDVKSCVLYASLASLPITLPMAGVGLAMASRIKDVSQIKSLAEEVLGKKITSQQAKAVERAHLVGEGSIGKDGVNLAVIGNYTPAHLRKKAEILNLAGFSKQEREKLIKNGVVGFVKKMRERSALKDREWQYQNAYAVTSNDAEDIAYRQEVRRAVESLGLYKKGENPMYTMMVSGTAEERRAIKKQIKDLREQEREEAMERWRQHKLRERGLVR